MTSIKEKSFDREIGSLFRSLSQPARIQILVALEHGEACVCHLESILGMRQAYLSQHLMALRDCDLVTARREGKFVFYRLGSPDLPGLLRSAAQIAGAAIPGALPVRKGESCACPSCSPTQIDLIQIGGGID